MLFKIMKQGKQSVFFASIYILSYFMIYIYIFKFLFSRPKICLSIHYIIIAKCQTVRRGEEMIPLLNLTRVFAFLGFIFPLVVYQLLCPNNNNNDLNVHCALLFHEHLIGLLPTHSAISLADDL